MEEKTAKIIVKVFAVIAILIAILYLFSGLILSTITQSFLIPFIMGILLFAGGIGLWRFKNWGRSLLFIIALIFIIKTLFSFIFDLIYNTIFSYSLHYIMQLETFIVRSILLILSLLYFQFFVSNKSIKKLFKKKDIKNKMGKRE